MIIIFIIAQRMYQDVEAMAIEHQPGDNLGERGRSENDLPLGGGMRTGDAVVVPEFDREPGSKASAYLISNGRATFISVINMRVIPVKSGHVALLPSGFSLHAPTLPDFIVVSTDPRQVKSAAFIVMHGSERAKPPYRRGATERNT